MKHIDRRQIQTIFHYRQKSPVNEQAQSGSRCENCHSVSEYWSFCARIAFCCPGVFSYLWGRNIGPAWPEPWPQCRSPPPHSDFTQKSEWRKGRWKLPSIIRFLLPLSSGRRRLMAGERNIPYKVGRKKVYMTPSAAETQGLVRADKHPKSTRYGRQNPHLRTLEQWPSSMAWRAAWADVSNRYLERAGQEERIDHRSNAARRY